MFKKYLVMAFVIALFSGCAQLQDFSNSIPGLSKKQKKVYTSDKDVLMFILDASGSMNETDNAGRVKIVAAKSMLKDISNQIDPSKTNVGLISFNNGCSSQLLIGPSNNDLNHVVNVSSQIQASGRTPLADSIHEAGEVLKNIHHKTNIIIISDGVETCNGDPVAEARKLKSQYGINASIYIIGYSVDGSTEMQLKRLASAGGGSYYSAQDSVALDKIIANITDKLNIKSSNWKGDTYKFKINFDSGSSILKNKYTNQIKKFAIYLKNTGNSAELQGHTDSTGSSKANKILSQKRAQAVVNKLIQLGVPKEHVYAVGFGELAPIADNHTKKGRFENRRVEAHIIKNGQMDISHINAANSKNIVNVKNATNNSFIGYYKVLDPNRNYDEYHIWMELYANNHGLYGEYQDNKNIVPANKNDLAWHYIKNRRSFILDYSDENKKPNWAKFEGHIWKYK